VSGDDFTEPLLAGVDEAGRGPLAGPVVAAAVILGGARPPGLNDSKQLSARRREQLFEAIMTEAAAVGVGMASVIEIDRLNILQASLLAMQRALAALPLAPRTVWVDGTHRPHCPYPVTALIGGDAKLPAISAASIIAKVTRDRIMLELEREDPRFGFARHKGYPTPDHLAALARHGASSAHRRSFAPVRRVLNMATP